MTPSGYLDLWWKNGFGGWFAVRAVDNKELSGTCIRTPEFVAYLEWDQGLGVFR
jgi:hypothetical protein